MFQPDKPGIPGKPLVTEMTPESATIVWTSPESDGGTPIRNYIVEKKDVTVEGRNWLVASKQSVPGPPFMVETLTPGQVYVFRVSAENETGIGYPSPPSESVALPDIEEGMILFS